MTATRVFDGHNDVLSKLHGSRPDDPVEAFIDGYDAAIDLPKSVEGGFAGGFFAVYVPPLQVDHEARLAAMTAESYALPLPPELEQSYAAEVANAQIGILRQLEARQALKICRSTGEIRESVTAGIMAAILTWKAPRPLTLIWPARQSSRHWPAFARTGLEPADHLRTWRALRLPVRPGYRPGPDRFRTASCQTMR